MATVNSSSVEDRAESASSQTATTITVLDTCDGAFHTDEVDGSSFTNSSRCFMYQLQCRDNKFLLLNTENHFQLQHLTLMEQDQLDCKFNIHPFNDSSLQERKGRAVMLCVNKGGKKMVACCRGENEVYVEVMQDLPKRIEKNQHKALFFLIHLTNNKYKLESSLYPSKFLGFEPIEHTPSLKKVVLLEDGYDGVNDDSEVFLTKK